MDPKGGPGGVWGGRSPPQVIASFLPEYPDLDDSDLPYQVARKKEFYDTRLDRDEPVPTEAGELLRHQKMLKRFFSPHTTYKTGLIHIAPGGGKCLLPGARVSTVSFGKLQIDKLWERYAIHVEESDGVGLWSKSTVPIQLWSYHEGRQEMVTASLARFYRQWVKEKVVRVTFDDDSSLGLTLLHKLYDGARWTSAYQEGDWVTGMNDQHDVVARQILSISVEDYTGWVYDLEIQPFHNFVANGVVAHNTCVGSAIQENFTGLTVDGQPHPPALVFVTGEDLTRTYRQEIANVCTKNLYLPRATNKEIEEGIEMTEEAKVARLNRAVSKSYQIVTYEQFLKVLPSDEVIVRNYSNRVIIVDEAHYLRIQPKTRGGRRREVETPQPPPRRSRGTPASGKGKGQKKGAVETPDPSEKDEHALLNSRQLYDKLHHFLHTVQNCIILAFTGSPIWDQTSEYGSLMNLILPLDQQLPTRGDFDRHFFDDEGNLQNVADLRRAMHGRVTYLRPLTSTARRIEMGVTDPLTKYLKVYPDVMSEFQAAAARRAREEVSVRTMTVKGKVVERESTGGVVWKKARGAANLVFPIFDESGEVVDVAYGQEAFLKYAVKKVKKRNEQGVASQVNVYGLEDKYLKREFKENLAEYSTKFASIISQIKAHPTENTFVYLEYVTAEGAILLALILQLHGFIWAKTANDIAAPSKQKRFAVVTSDPATTSQPKQVQDLLRSVNKSDNRYGERCQVIIGTEKIALGQTLKNFRQFHLEMPEWNIPSTEQPSYRVFRVGSHQALPPEERYVKIFRHAAVEAGELQTEESFPPGVGYSPEETMDMYIYRVAEEKDYRNIQIYRLEKEEDFACPLNYRRNVLKEDVDGTRDCDYQECNYECDGFPPTSKKHRVWRYEIPEGDLDPSTYNLFYAQPEIDKVVEQLRELFQRHFALHIHLVAQMLGLEASQYPLLLAAVDHMLNTRMLLRNQYGFGCYLKEQGNMLFLDDTISTESTYPESNYIENPLITERNSFEALIEVMELEKDSELVEVLCQDPIEENLEAVAFKTQIILLEAAYQMSIRDPENEGVQRVLELLLDKLGDRLYTMSDGSICHLLYTEEFHGLSYDVAAKEIVLSGLMRRFDGHEWNYVTNEKEELEYLKEIRAQIAATREISFSGNPYGVYGWVSKQDKTFRIVIKSTGKGAVRGRACMNFHHISMLISILITKFKFYPHSKAEYKNLSRKELIKAIKARQGVDEFKKGLDQLDDKKLRSLLTAMTSSIRELCDLIRKFLADHDLLYEL